MHVDDVLYLGIGVTLSWKLIGQRLDTDKRPNGDPFGELERDRGLKKELGQIDPGLPTAEDAAAALALREGSGHVGVIRVHAAVAIERQAERQIVAHPITHCHIGDKEKNFAPAFDRSARDETWRAAAGDFAHGTEERERGVNLINHQDKPCGIEGLRHGILRPGGAVFRIFCGGDPYAVCLIRKL